MSAQIVLLDKPQEYRITKEGGGWIAIGKRVQLIVDSGLSIGKIFKRRSVKRGRVNGETCWLVGELDGVRTYISETEGRINIIITREELNP